MRHCDQCHQSEKVSPVHDTFATLARTIPGTGGKSGRATTDKFPPHKLGELCESCGQRFDLAVANLVAAIKMGETALPELPPALDAGTDGEVTESTTEEPEGSGEVQPELPLGGTDEDTSGGAIDGGFIEPGDSPETVVGKVAAVEANEDVIGRDSGGTVTARRRRGQPTG